MVKRSSVLSTLVGLVVSASLSFAQITSTLYGVIRDTQGGVLPGVTVTVESPSLVRGQVTGVTDAQGRYRIPGLQPGQYALVAELAGFATARVTGIEVRLDSEVQVDLEMTLAELEEQVTVIAETQAIRVKQSDLQGNIAPEVIDGIPLNGRQFLDLLSLLPGTTFRPPSSDQGAGVTVFSERSITNSFLVDGLDNNDPLSRDIGEFFIQDAIQEFNVMLGGYQAEFGRAQGAVANIITRSGTNRFQGRLFGFFRDDAMDSSNIEDQPPQKLSRQEVGGTFGGPLSRDRTFFFDAFQLFRETRGVNLDQAIVPPLLRSAFFSPSVDQEPFDRSPTERRYTNFLKVDHQLNARNQLFATLNINRGKREFIQPTAGQAGPPGTIILPSASDDFAVDTTSANARHTAFLDPNSVLESSFRFARLDFAQNEDKPRGAELVFPFTFTPTLRIWMTNASVMTLVDRTQDQFQWAESLSLYKDTTSWGTHSLKFGADLNRVQLRNVQLWNTSVVFANTALETRSEELGLEIDSMRWGESVLDPPDETARATNNNWGFFGQDSWEVAPGLTFNLGLRYDYASLFAGDKDNFSPRLGFAWDIGSGGKTVVRASWGRFYDQTIMDAVPLTPELGGVQTGLFSLQVIPRGGSFYNNPAIGAYGPLQDSGTRWLANPTFYSYVLPEGDVRTSGDITITGRGQPYIVYELLGIPVDDPANPPVLKYDTISALTGGRLTPEEAIRILNDFFPGNDCDDFHFLDETGEGSVHSGRPLSVYFGSCGVQVDSVVTLQHPVRTPYTDSFNAGFEQALGDSLSLEAQIFIRRSRDLLAKRVINLLDVPVAASCSGNTIDGGPCNRELQYIGFLDTNAGVVSLRKRFGRGYSFLASYTYTDATDNFSTLAVRSEGREASFLFNNRPELDEGRSLNTPEHTFTFSSITHLPLGLELSGVLSAASGRPFNAAGLPLDSDGDVIFDNRLIGTEKGGFVTDPFFNADLRLAKVFTLGGDSRLTALFELFNVTNRANPLEVNRVCGDTTGDRLPDPAGCGGGDFGRLIRAYPGREIQLGIRYDF